MLPLHSSPEDVDSVVIGQPKFSGISQTSIVGPQITFREYFGRMLRYTQMDFDYTFAQMVYLCIAPNKVYQLTQYRKRTKGVWARDDPCFIVLQGFFLAMSGLAYGVCFGETWLDQLRSFMYFFVLHFVVLGLGVSALSIFVADKYLRKKASTHQVVQPIEWLYAFDVHCNAFFPLFLLTYVVQYFLLPVLYSSESLVSCVASNLLHTAAVTYYCYVVSLGYNTLPFLERAEVFMIPSVVLAIVALVLTISRTNLTVIFVEWTVGVL